MAEKWNTSKILEKVPKCLNSANVDDILVQFLLMSDVDHRISSETFVQRPNSPVLFPLIVYVMGSHGASTEKRKQRQLRQFFFTETYIF